MHIDSELAICYIRHICRMRRIRREVEQVARVQVINEVPSREATHKDWILCLQWCRYFYDDGNMQHGYRFIWRRPGGSLQPARGQARIISLEDAERLMSMAREQGWGDYRGD